MTATATAQRPQLQPLDFLDIDRLLTDEDRLIAETVRRFAADRVVPRLETWYEEGFFPKELGPEIGALGLLGMHLSGYGCAGASAVSYGVACRELEAADSGLRSFVSVQGSLAMFPIWKYGSEEQKQQWLPGMAAGELIGCFGLTEPDSGSDPAAMKTSARRAGGDWVLNGTKMWITNGGLADVAVVWARTDEGVRGFLVPRGTKGFTTQDIHRKFSLRASVTSELLLDDVRLPEDAVLPGVTGMRGRLVVVTGGGRGIGRAVAERFAAAGERVVAVGRDPATADEVCDVTDEDAVEALFGRLGDVDVLVNNAGMSSSAPLRRTSLDDWRAQVDVNATGAFLCTRAALPGMVERDAGRVVTVASTAGRVGYRYTAGYTASKHAAVGLMRAVAAEVAGTGVTANAVCPAFVRTDMTARSVE